MTKHHFVCLTVAMLFAACGDSADNNAASNNTTANNTSGNNTTAANNTTGNNTTGANNTTGTTGAVSFSADVVPIFTGAGCANGSCHGAPGNGTSFLIEAPAGAAEFQAALDGIATAGGRSLVAGGDLDNSELYLRVTGTGVSQMPFGGALDPADIDTITNWISEGGAFD